MTGSIACFKACALISKLVQAGHHVKVVASPSALQFVGAATLEGLTGESVVSDLWEKGEAMAHIHLMRWADVIAVIPASAHFINRVSQGIGDDLLTTMFLAHDFKKPYLIAPAMNTSMYLHPVTQKSIRSLKEMGVEILEAASGVLACGEVGYGRLLEPALLQEEIEKRLSSTAATSPLTENETASRGGLKHGKTDRKILITSGGTQEPIDQVRVISNLSTGRTGALLTDHLSSLGFSVVLMHARGALLPKADVEKLSFVSSADLSEALGSRLRIGDIHAVIHMAAVSDFVLRDWEQDGVRHAGSNSGKISSGEDLTLRLKRNPKVLDGIRGMSPVPLHLTAFKMTANADENGIQTAVRKVFEGSKPDWVVQNDTSEIDHSKNLHRMRLYRAGGPDSESLESVGHLAQAFASEYSSIFFQRSQS